jgi:uncharacterized protein YegP (UPF0339 family)
MSGAWASRFEMVRTDVGWHARFRASNRRIVWVTEVYTRRASAKKAILSVAQSFTLSRAHFTFVRDDLHVLAGGVSVEVREVDEREARP